jgi:hypothetical protein
LNLVKLLPGLLLAAPVFADTPDWQQAFPVDQATHNVYAEAHYLDAQGMPHVLQLWREGGRQLTRLTDRSVMITVTRNSSDEDSYQVYDLKRKTVIDADRSQLYRIGIFTDWMGMAHVLSKPQRTTYAITVMQPATQTTAWGLCHWYKLSLPDQDDREICWSTAWALPLLIRQHQQPVFNVSALSNTAPDSFTGITRQAYTRIDINDDIDSD